MLAFLYNWAHKEEEGHCDIILLRNFHLDNSQGWSGGAMVLGKLPVPGRPTIWITVGQGPTALAVDAGGGSLVIFTLIYPSSPLSPSLWEVARYRLKYCLKGPLNPKQPTNQLKALVMLILRTIFQTNIKAVLEQNWILFVLLFLVLANFRILDQA